MLSNQDGYRDIYTMLYNRRNADEVLRAKGVRFSLIKGVVLRDPEQIWVDIIYATQGIDSTMRVSGIEFLALMWADRMHRSSSYRAVPMTGKRQIGLSADETVADEWSGGDIDIVVGIGCITKGGREGEVWHSDQVKGVYCVVEPLPRAYSSSGASYQVTAEENGVVSCGCPDYGNQLHALQEHQALWRLIRQQPRCKHLLAGAGALERSDLLQMPIPDQFDEETARAVAEADQPTVELVPLTAARSVQSTQAEGTSDGHIQRQEQAAHPWRAKKKEKRREGEFLPFSLVFLHFWIKR